MGALLAPGSGPSFDDDIRPGHFARVPLADAHRVEAPFVRAELDFLPHPSDVCGRRRPKTPAMVRRYSATYDAEKAARAHERFSPADRMGERLG